MKKVELHTDGSCLFNNSNLEFSPGGWCYILRYKQNEKVEAGYETKTTNNRMELTAIINGLKSLIEKCDVDFYSDSNYAIKGMSEYLTNWKRENRLNDEHIKNADLWKELDKLIEEKVNIATYTWVKGHNNNKISDKKLEFARIQNNRCDLLARSKAEEIYTKIK